MASQRSKHTQAQLSGLYAYHQNKECPSCKDNRFKVVESRKTVEGTRRRYKCGSCGFKQTMYEISSECYEELRVLRSRFALIQQALLDVATTPTAPVESAPMPSHTEVIPCTDCVHLTPYGCSFDIPEAQTEAAKGCNLFQSLI